MKAGDVVRIDAPFDKQYPGEYTVVGFNEGGAATVVVSADNIDFDAEFLIPTGKAGALPDIVIEAKPAATKKADIKEALWSGGDPVEMVAALFGVKD